MSDQNVALIPIDGSTPNELFELVYNELRRLAGARMANEAGEHTLQPTALVHEAWLRMVRDEDRNWETRAGFFAAASRAMRRILVEHARRKNRQKRGGSRRRMNLEISEMAGVEPDEKILMVEEALTHLERLHPDWAQIVVMKYFGGMTQPEIAAALGMGERSVRRYWTCARVWLYDHIRSVAE
ncbi:MAG: sigma-70 family RNA polymerase sigma factor [Pontiellaceae bacterium]|nr:sigma-70 family RNA polymerase sigma factor [Pontiellaceae bacterium]MBN2784806.1 sigma-70 family RNA polymerase sigma factor [Pontiellaceae bacterium]